MSEKRASATAELKNQAAGETNAADRLFQLIYAELRRLANTYLQRERGCSTLQPTALVHEAYLRMIDVNQIDWKGKSHFFAMAATQMRRILVEQARRANAQKRGADRTRVTLDDRVAIAAAPSIDLLALDEALEKLARRHPRRARVAELRLFAGLSVPETAFAIGVSERTVKKDWTLAQARLSQSLASGDAR